MSYSKGEEAVIVQTQAASQKQLDELCINTIRTLSMDAVQQANSGHSNQDY